MLVYQTRVDMIEINLKNGLKSKQAEICLLVHKSVILRKWNKDFFCHIVYKNKSTFWNDNAC